MKKQQKKQDALSYIEESTADEFDQLADLGPDMYSTAALLVLKGKWEANMQSFLELHQIIKWIGFSSPVWVLLALSFGFFKWYLPGLICLTLFPVAFLTFAVGSYLLKVKFTSKGYLEYIGNLIDEELLHRRELQPGPKRRRN